MLPPRRHQAAQYGTAVLVMQGRPGGAVRHQGLSRRRQLGRGQPLGALSHRLYGMSL